MPDFKAALEKLRAEQKAKAEQDSSQPFGGSSANRSIPRDGSIVPVKRAADLADELEGEEWLKKPELMAFGRFNIIGASKRMSTFKNRTFEQTNFHVQLLDGDYRGCTAMVSFESNMVRDKIYALVEQYGGVGPFHLEKQASGENEAYVFVPDNDNDGQTSLASNVTTDAPITRDNEKLEQTETPLPFDEPSTSGRRKR